MYLQNPERRFFLIGVFLLLLPSFMPVNLVFAEPLVVEVLFEVPVGWNRWGHSALRVGDKVYDISKEGEGEGKTHIRERDWSDVCSDERNQWGARISLDEETANVFKEFCQNEVGKEFDYNFLTNNCADWVEDKLRMIGVDLQDDPIQKPRKTWEQTCEHPLCFFFWIPEYPIGTIVPIIMSLIALILVRKLNHE